MAACRCDRWSPSAPRHRDPSSRSSGAPPVCPPFPSSPWQTAQLCVKMRLPSARFARRHRGRRGRPAARRRGRRGVAAAVRDTRRCRAERGPSFPSRPNSHTLSPRADPSSALPAEYASTYCLPLVLERAHRRVHAGAGLKLPELRAGRRVERRQPAIVAADEQQAAAGRQRAAVALLRPLIAPRQLVRRHVERRDDAGARARA